MAPRDKTDVSINGERTTLVFGDYYRVRYGKNSAIIEDGRLESRANNGDLVFSVAPYGIGGIAVTKRRVRPSAIDAIFGSGVPKLELDEAGEIRTEPAPDGHVRDEIIAASAKSRAARETLDDRLAREVDAALDPALPAAILAGAIEKAPKLTKAGHAKLVAAGADPEAVAAATSAEDVPGVVVRTGKAYADRNQVWKCGTCKKRTRRPECVGTTDAPHPAVSAPAGKRLTDRLGDR